MPESFSIIFSQCLYVEANEPSLHLGRLKISLQNIVKLKANIDNPAFDRVFHPPFENVYDGNQKCIKSIGLRIQKHIDDFSIPLDIVKSVIHTKIPPWKLLKSELDTSL